MKIRNSLGITIIILIFLLFLVGCDSTKTVNVTFQNGEHSYVVSIPKGSRITDEYNPFNSSVYPYHQVKLFYDENKKKQYNNKKIYHDITLYVRIEKNDLQVIKSNKINNIIINDNDSLKKIDDQGKNNNLINNLNGIIFEEISKIRVSTSSDKIYKTNEYTWFLNELDHSSKITINYLDDLTTTFYINKDNKILIDDIYSGVAYISILNCFSIDKLMEKKD